MPRKRFHEIICVYALSKCVYLGIVLICLVWQNWSIIYARINLNHKYLLFVCYFWKVISCVLFLILYSFDLTYLRVKILNSVKTKINCHKYLLFISGDKWSDAIDRKKSKKKTNIRKEIKATDTIREKRSISIEYIRKYTYQESQVNTQLEWIYECPE